MWIGRKVAHHNEGEIASFPEDMRQVCAYIIMDGGAMVHGIPPEYQYLYRACGFEFVELRKRTAQPNMVRAALIEAG